MGYDYESLLDEHFQHLCQSLLIDSFPRLQCMPVGMPDGGRDGTSPADLRGTIVFQVKFARNPHAVKDPVAWVKNAIEGELDKIQELVNRNATEYVLLTNMPGTSHLDSGRIDKVSAYLRDVLQIPAACWWRDEIDRRLDRNFDLKLRFPSLLNGADFLRLFWESSKERPAAENNALKAYLAAQYEQDKTVRFKQAELQASALFQIFVDVPVSITPRRGRKAFDSRTAQQLAAAARRAAQASGEKVVGSSDGSNDGQPEYVLNEAGEVFVRSIKGSGAYTLARAGAADVLLDSEFSSDVRFVVLEGAPGQGKSTLTQYLGQVHRSRLLTVDHGRDLPRLHSQSPIAVPFRLELRDLAQWLNGIDPWSNEEGQLHKRQRSLETAIAGQVHHLSGYAPFGVADLHRLIESTPVYLLLDGLDEVADLDDRRRAVEEVLAAITRLDGIAKNLHVLVTSRPTVFSSSATFPEDRFTFLKLGSIHRELALEYTDRWAVARNLEEKDKAEVRAVLAEKMNAPHMAELAKNTMQLSILLSLIYLRGASLPDKRTELYDTYVDTFFNRESEKSAIVRKNRKLLIEIHWYLAYYIHANAEGNRSNGRIRVAELRKVLTEYLVREGRSPELVEELVIGTVERVVALVSRVEGTYEFEVQPLREYFAARFLYETASYSPAGRARKGTKPDRFDAVARNPYWLNVARFFAGCFSKGELLDLAERICLLIRARQDTYPRSLAIAFLQDWVFAQSVTATHQVIDTIFDGYGIRIFGGITPSRRDQVDLDDDFRLGPEAGGTRLAEILWERLKRERRRTERTDSLCRLLVRHADTALLADAWLTEARKRKNDRLVGWLRIGRYLGVLSEVSEADLGALLGENKSDPSWASLALAGAASIELDDGSLRESITYALNHPKALSSIQVQAGPGLLLALVSPEHWMEALRPFYYGLLQQGQASEKIPKFRDPELNVVLSKFIDLMREPRHAKLSPWVEAVQRLDKEFGQTWTSQELALISGAVIDPGERGAGAKHLLDEQFQATDRVRFAKRRPRNIEWWVAQASSANSDLDMAFWIAATYAWADTITIVHAIPKINEFMRSLPPDMRSVVAYACRRSPYYSDRARKSLPIRVEELGAMRLAAPTLCLLSQRLQEYDLGVLKIIDRHAREPWTASALLTVAAVLWGNGTIPNSHFLSICEKAQALNGRLFGRLRSDLAVRATKEIVGEVSAQSWALPDGLIAWNVRYANRPRKVRSVLSVAEEEDWLGQGEAR
ncbi:NACHT domain-containing protein [Micromonospora carbonacea]|uniref:NACHT domain-containing protein n=1 Tax=Micromonospora carbonacea TaxID=47853 RepID=UPI003D981252